jgi:regulator of cell morphogenesis and NO signaling
MPTISVQDTVGQLVAQRPARSRVFEGLGIDYCCGGKKTLAEVCERKGLDGLTVLGMLTALDASEAGSTPGAVHALAMTMGELADHIEQTHHAYLKRELPRLEAMVGKVAKVHGGRYGWMLDVQRVFGGFKEELEAHMMKEERILFPLVRAMEAGADAAQGHCESVVNPIRVMEMEHDHAGDALAEMRRLTDGFTPPTDACNTFLATLDGLKALEADMHQHVHKENSILFPRAVKAEAELRERIG